MTKQLFGFAVEGFALTSDMERAVRAGLPRPIRDALVSWNHGTEYELPSWQSYSSGGGKGLFEKTYDLGEPLFLPTQAFQHRGHLFHSNTAGFWGHHKRPPNKHAQASLEQAMAHA